MNQVRATAATGSAHHHPRAAFAPSLTKAVADSHMHVVVWNASETIARLPIAFAARRFAPREEAHHDERRDQDADPERSGLGTLAHP